MPSTKKTLVIIDSFALIFRAYYAYPPTLTDTKGKPINAVYGFTSLMLDVLLKFKPDNVIAVFDPQTPIIRQSEFVLYKSNRKETDSELVEQIPRVKELLESFDIPVLRVDGYEADDVIATIDKKHSGTWAQTIVVTGDQDLFQLVDEDTSVYLAGRKFSESKLYDAKGVFEKLGITPNQVPDYKGLAGDASDNIPGVKGIGKKSAEDLIKEFGSIDAVYQNLDKLKTRQRNLLSENYEMAIKSRDLATVEANVPISFDFNNSDFSSTLNIEKIKEVFEELKFKSLQGKLQKLSDVYIPQDNFEEVDSGQTNLFGEVDLNIIEFTKEDLNNTEKIFLLSKVKNTDKSPINWNCGEMFFKKENSDELFIVSENRIEEFFKLVANKNIELITFDVKSILHCLQNIKFDTTNLEYTDIGFLAVIMEEGTLGYSLDKILSFYGENYSNDLEQNLVAIQNVYNKLIEKIESSNKLKKVYELESNLLPFVVQMEQHGIEFDTEILKKYELELSEKKQNLLKSIYEDVGHEFNVNSPRQVGEVLFSEKQLSGAKKTKSGQFSTNEKVLKKLTAADPVVQKILDYREIDKLLSTYVKPLPIYIDFDSRIHATFDQLGAVSGRFSSKNPNLQNIPINANLEINIRNAFVAPKNKKLVSFDYSQQELRILAVLAEEKEMIESFNNDEDIHKLTAAEMFGVEIDKVTPQQRQFGKTVNFSVVYGISAFGLSERLGVDRNDAQLFINKYYEKYKNVAKYFENQKDIARKQGYVETVLGRRRSSATINSVNRFMREAAERELLNFRIQGTAADIMKIAMVKIAEILPKYSAKLLLQIHDEFVFEIDESEDLDMFQKDVKKIMENALDLGIKYKVDSNVGKRWGELK